MLPGVVVLTLAVLVIVRTDTGMLVAQSGSVLPDAQLFPVAVEVAVVDRILSPVSGLLTVAEKVIVVTPPGARLPVQVRTGLA